MAFDPRNRRAVMDAMMMQNLQQPIVGQGIGPWIQGIAKVLGAYGNEQRGQQMDAEAAQGLQGGMEKFMRTFEGQPEQVMPAGVQGPPRPETPANPRQAVFEAMGSQYPELQDLGRDVFKQQFATKERKRNVMNIDGRLIEVPEQGDPRQIGDYSKPPEQWESFVEPDPETGKNIKFRRNVLTGKEEQITNPGTRVSQTVGGTKVTLPGQDKGFDALASAAVKNFEKRAEGAQGAIDMMTNLDQMLTLDKDGKLVSGPLAEPALFLQGIARSVGLDIGKENLADAQTYRAMASHVAQAYINTLQGGARGITEKEAQIIMQSVPQLQQSPEARAQVAKILRDVARRKVEDFKKAEQNLHRALKTQDMSQYEFGSTMIPDPQPIPAKPGLSGSGGTKSNPIKDKWPGAR